MSSKIARKARGKAIDSWKQKQWFEIYAPKSFKETLLGQIPAETPDQVMGRIIDILLYDITQNFKHTTTKLNFKITEVNGQRANTVFWGQELTRDFIRSLIHRGSTRIDGIFNFTTADKVVYRVSTFVVTRRRAKQSQQHAMRKIIYQVLNEFARNLTHEKFIQGIIYGKFANNIRKIARTIYPLRECAIRKVKVVTIPEGIKDEILIEEEDEFKDVDVNLGEHGKIIKAKKARKRKEQEKSSEEEGTDAEKAAEIPEPKEDEIKEFIDDNEK